MSVSPCVKKYVFDDECLEIYGFTCLEELENRADNFGERRCLAPMPAAYNLYC